MAWMSSATLSERRPFAVCKKSQTLPACVDLIGGRRASAALRMEPCASPGTADRLVGMHISNVPRMPYY